MGKKSFKFMQILFIALFALLLTYKNCSGVIRRCQYLKGVDNAKVSVIVPVYNTENYLEETLRSLENQTLDDLEIICVNDGSTDSSLAILRNHAKKDSRIKIVDQKNKGVSVARNNGIRTAKGKYIMFADSDDLLPPYACEKAFECAEIYKSDIVTLGNICFTDGEQIDLNSFSYDESNVEFHSCETYQNPYRTLKIEMSSIWNKIWKKSWLINNDVWFKEGITRGEDGLFNMIAFSNVTSVVQNNNVFYCYRQNRPNSALTTSNAKKILQSVIPCAYELLKNRYRFNFDDSDEWIVDNILSSTFARITEDLTDDNDKIYFANKTVDVLESEFVQKNGIILNADQQEKVNILKNIANIKK